MANENNLVQTAQTTSNNNGEVNQRIQKSNPVNLVLMLLLVVLAAWGTALYFQKGSIISKTATLDQDIITLKGQIADLKEQKVEFNQNAAEALTKIKSEELLWSDVISEVNKLLPVDESGQRKVNILSYSGSGNGKIALNSVTAPAALPPYDQVSRMLTTFNNSVFFKDAYVPAISKSTTENGNTTLSFILNLSYQKPETGAAELNLPMINLNSDNSTNTAVPAVKTDSATKVSPILTEAAPKIPRNQ